VTLHSKVAHNFAVLAKEQPDKGPSQVSFHSSCFSIRPGIFKKFQNFFRQTKGVWNISQIGICAQAIDICLPDISTKLFILKHEAYRMLIITMGGRHRNDEFNGGTTLKILYPMQYKNNHKLYLIFCFDVDKTTLI